MAQSTDTGSAIERFLKNTKMAAELDAYYAYDLGTSVERDFNDRQLTGVAAFNNEFRLNLLSLEMAHQTDDYRFGIRLRYGDVPLLLIPVDKQYTRYLQLAYMGVAFSSKTWVDIGCLNNPIGFEGTNSANWLCSNSVAGYCEPGGIIGVRVTQQCTDNLSLAIGLYNSYSIISANNTNKSIIASVNWTPTDNVSMAYNTSIGDEAPSGTQEQLQSFNNLYVSWSPFDRLDVIAQADAALQKNSKNLNPDSTHSGTASFVSGVLALRYRISDKLYASCFVEAMNDPSGFITNGAAGSSGRLHTNGFALGLRYLPTPNTFLRLEYSFLKADQNIFLHKDNDRGSIIFSAGIRLEN
jgi:hypothetical protein